MKKDLEQNYKNTMAMFVNGVAIISTKMENEKFTGFTATSLTSVSIDPPTILFCINKNSSQIENLKKHNFCGVSILSNELEKHAMYFASKSKEKFNASIDYNLGSHTKMPILKNSVAYLECMVEEFIEVAKNYIIIAKVINAEKSLQKENCLVYKDRKFFSI